MSESRTTELIEASRSGSEFVICDYDDDVDIAGPKQYSITTSTKKVSLKIRIKYAALATIAVNTGLVVGSGGSMNAGTSLTFTKRDQASSDAPVVVIKKDYVLGNSGQSAGTAIYTELQLPAYETVIQLKLKASTIYGLVITSIADNNYGNVIFEVDEI
jgi:hypothetical protein